LAHGIQEKLGELCGLVQRAVVGVEKSGVQQPAHTVSGRLEQARRWLAHPDRDDRGLGQQAIALIVTEGKKVSFNEILNFLQLQVVMCYMSLIFRRHRSSHWCLNERME
jgi:hypothetical protein